MHIHNTHTFVFHVCSFLKSLYKEQPVIWVYIKSTKQRAKSWTGQQLNTPAKLNTKHVSSKALSTQSMYIYNIYIIYYGKHFFWTSLHFFWTWTLLLDLTTILLEMATLLLDLRGPHPSLLLDLALSQTIPLLDRFSSFCPAASASQFSDSRALELH